MLNLNIDAEHIYDMIIVGGGNSAVEDALILSRICERSFLYTEEIPCGQQKFTMIR